MKKVLLNSIDSFVSALFTFGKVGQAQFVRTNFPKIVEGVWDDDKSDSDNIKNVEDQFIFNKNLNQFQGNTIVSQCIDAFLEGWFVDVKKML